MDFEKDLFESAKVKAPDDFTTNTMNYILNREIQEQEKATTKIEYSFFKLGQICVVASLLLVMLNVFPAEDIVRGQDYFSFPSSEENIIKKGIDKIEDIFENVKELIDFEINFNDIKGDK